MILNKLSKKNSAPCSTDLIDSNCHIRIKTRFCQEKVYLDEAHYYGKLSAYLTNESEHVHICSLYEQIVSTSERPHLVQALLHFYIGQNKIVEMLRSFLLTEIERCADLSTLFRPATICTSLMDHYMRRRCEPFLRKALQEPLTRILSLDTRYGYMKKLLIFSNIMEKNTN